MAPCGSPPEACAVPLLPSFVAALLAGAVLALVPLLRAVDYPLALAAAPAASVIAAVWGSRHGRASLARFVPRCAGLALAVTAFLVLPSALSSVVSGSVCDPLYGMLFVLLGPVPSAVVAAACGAVLARRVPVRRRAWATAAAVALVLLSPAVPVAEFLWSPSVRFYGTFFGLYHGAVYDEAVFVDPALAWLRCWNLSGLAALAGLALHSEHRGPRDRTDREGADPPATCPQPGSPRVRVAASALAAVGAAGFVALGVLGPRLGFLQTPGRSLDVLAATAEAPGFEVRYREGGKAARVAGLVAADMTFRAARIQRFLGAGPADGIRVYLYDSPGAKARVMGAGRTSIAKPWRNELHVHTADPGANVLAHELAHVMLAQASGEPLGVPADLLVFPRAGIVEGAAVAVERGQSLLTTHQWAAAMRAIGKQPDLPSIMAGLRFWASASSVAYTACGSFVRHLVETRGAASFLEVYGGDSFDAAYGASLEDLVAEWNRFLDSIPLSADDLDLARFVFSPPSVFEKTCPYAVGRCMDQAARALAAGRPATIASLARVALAMGRDDPAGAVKLARLQLSAGLPAQARTLIEETADSGAGPVLQAATRMALADALWLDEGSDPAASIYEELAQTPARRWLGDELRLRRLAAAERVAGPVRTLLLRSYAPRDEDAVAAAAFEALNGTSTCAPAAVVGLRLAAMPGHYLEAATALESAVARCPADFLSLKTILSETWIWTGRCRNAAALLLEMRKLTLTPAELETIEDLEERAGLSPSC